MTSGTYTDVEGRVSRLEGIKPCTMLKGWIHAIQTVEKFEGNEWKTQRKQVTICVWGNHGVKTEKGQI